MKLQALIHRSNNSNLMWTFLQCSLFCLSMCVRRKNSFISNCQSTKHEKFKPRKKTDKFGFTRSQDLSMFIKRSHKTSAKEDRELERTMLLHLQQVKKKKLENQKIHDSSWTHWRTEVTVKELSWKLDTGHCKKKLDSERLLPRAESGKTIKHF